MAVAHPSVPEPLVRLGWDRAWADAAGAAACGAPGRVTRVDRGVATVLTADGPVRAASGADLLAAVAESSTAAPTVGDWVLVRSWPDDRTTLELVLPRRTTLVRASPGRRSDEQLLAANASVVAVTVALVPDPGQAKVERLLTLAAASGARPVLVVTKSDLVSDGFDVAAELAADAPDVRTLLVSARTGAGIDELRGEVGAGGTMALVGSSGVGKSSLVNAMVGAQALGTRAIRADGRGRHTTVRRELVALPGGGCVIDTPGLRGVGLVPGGDGVAATFADIEALAAGCRFDDCTHQVEPGCAIVAAIESGALPVRRLDAWQGLQRELAWRRRRADARPLGTASRSGRGWRR